MEDSSRKVFKLRSIKLQRWEDAQLNVIIDTFIDWQSCFIKEYFCRCKYFDSVLERLYSILIETIPSPLE